MLAWLAKAEGSGGEHPGNEDPGREEARRRDRGVVLVMVPGMGMRAEDFHVQGLVSEIGRRGWPVTVSIVDPGADAYLDGSVEARLLDGIVAARRAAGVSRVWLAGISLGCQGILRCVRAQPGIAEGVMLLTPYLASTGLIAEIGRAGGLRSWVGSDGGRCEAERALLRWLAMTPAAELPRMLVGCALADRFAATALMLADLAALSQVGSQAGSQAGSHVVSVAGGHDWASWGLLWRLMLERDPFGQRAVVEP